MEKIKQEEIVNKIEKILPKTKGRFAPEDIAVATGYSLADVNDALKRLLEIYRARVVVDTNTGKLIFNFNYPLEKVGKKTFQEHLFEFLQFLWKVFQVVYKAAIGVILIFYTIVFVLILLGLMIISFSSNRDRKEGGGFGFEIFAGIFRAIFEGLYILSWTNAIEEIADPSGLRYKKYAKEKNKGKNFVQSVFHFVFGPDNPPIDKFADEKEAMAYVRKVSNGRLTAADIVLLTGCSYDEAEERLARYAVKFGGELDIDENGTVVADFSNILHTAQKIQEGKIVYYFDEIEPPAELTGNTTGKNIAIILMNSFNLVMSFMLINFSLTTDSNVYINETAIRIPEFVIYALGWFPFIFSISFFIIPLLRIPFVMKHKARRENNIMRKKLFYAIYKLQNNITFEKIAQLINLPKELYDKALQVLHKLIVDLRGEIELTNDNSYKINVDNFIKNISMLRSRI